MSTTRQISSAMIDVIERARGRPQSHPSARLFSIALMTVFFIALMGCLTAGARVYRACAQAQAQANALHLESGLIANVVRSHDAADAVSLGEGPEGPSLVLTRKTASRSYETRIYQYEGSILQESAVEGRPYDPLSAINLLDTTVFELSLEDDLLTFTTDQGSFCVALRSTRQASSTGGE